MTAAPLRILVITSRPMITEHGNPIDLLDVEKERRRIADGLRKSGIAARVRFLAEATTNATKDALRDEWDVIHYTGHGTADGCLVLENGTGVAHFLTAEETAQLFAASETPLVILSACYSETIGRGLIAAGVPSVIAIDAATPIADEAAIIFAEHFYKAMARGWTVQRSFTDARQTVALDSKVGDKNPPLDRSGEAETPWSERFTLLGDGARQMTVSEGEYREPDARVQENLREYGYFVGRAREISDVAKAFDGGASRVTLWGPGGVGKTALSRAVARWHAEREKVGVVMWTSAGRDERQHRLRDLASLLAIASRSFEIGVTEQSNFEEQKRAVRDFLESHDAMLILDNWETIEPDNRLDLWDFVLSLSNRVRVLVTSRDVLPAKDARNIELKPLAMDDAVWLFAQVARNAGYFDRNPNLSEEDIGILYAICERLSGYALAVQVAAGQTVSRALGEIWDDLRRYPKAVLEGIDELTGEPRGVWTSLDLSYKVLSDEEKAMFRRMSVLLAPATADDVAAVTEVARSSLDALVRRSLVQMSEGLYSLLPVMRMYAESKLEEAGEDPRPLHIRAVDHYRPQNTLESAIKASGHLYELASRYELREAAEEFARFVPNFYQDLVTSGDWAEAHRKAEQLVSVARAIGNKEMETNWLFELANMLYRVGEYERAYELYGDVKKGSEDADNKSGIASTLHQMGMIAQDQGEYGEAMRLYEESLRLKKELGDKSGIAATLYQLGTVHQYHKDFKAALKNFVIAAQIAVHLHHPNLRLAVARIQEIRTAIGEGQFSAWLSQLPIEDDLRTELLEPNESDGEQEAQGFFNSLVAVARAVVEARARADSDEISALAGQLSQIEDAMRKQGGEDVANFFAALRALLAGEDAGEKIAALVEPFNQIAQQAGDAINKAGA